MTDPPLVVERLVAGGDGLAREPSGRVVFVRDAVPDDRVRVEFVEERRDFAKAEIAELVEPGPARVEPPCPFVAVGCGGCGWQHVEPAAARAEKVAIVAEAARRIGKLDLVVVPGPDLPAAARRNTIRVAATDGGLGFRRRRSHDAVRVDACMVAHPLFGDLLQGRLVGADEVTFRASPSTGERLAVVHGAASARLASVGDDVAVVTDEELDAGANASLRQMVRGHEFEVSARSFFQTSQEGAEALVDEVVDAVAGAPEGRLADLYGGVGLLAKTAADGREVVLVESGADAVRDARANLADEPVTVVDSTVDAWTPVPCAVVVADPPRAGLGRSGVERVVATGAARVVLVSCDAAAFARDVSALVRQGYSVARTSVLELFPFTPHVEVVTTMQLG